MDIFIHEILTESDELTLELVTNVQNVKGLHICVILLEPLVTELSDLGSKVDTCRKRIIYRNIIIINKSHRDLSTLHVSVTQPPLSSHMMFSISSAVSKVSAAGAALKCDRTPAQTPSDRHRLLMVLQNVLMIQIIRNSHIKLERVSVL